MRLVEVSLAFEPRDLWWGVFWRRSDLPARPVRWRARPGLRRISQYLTLYVCLVPMAPLKVTLFLRRVWR